MREVAALVNPTALLTAGKPTMLLVNLQPERAQSAS